MQSHEEGRTAARRAVTLWLIEHEQSRSWLYKTAGIDAGTLNEFLNGNRWPAEATQGKIERALGWSVGTISGIAEGLTEPPSETSDETFSKMSEDTSTLLFRRPGGLSDEEWADMRKNIRGYIEWQMWRVSGGEDTAQ